MNALSNFCLDSNLEGSVYAIDCNGGDYQYWQIQGGRLVNVATGRCLDSNIDGFLYTLDCNGGDYQHWQRQGELLVNVATGLCLYGRGNDVLTFACSPPSSGTSDGPRTASPNWK